MEIISLIALILGVFNLMCILYLFFKLNSMPSLLELDEDIDDLFNKLDKLENDLEVYMADVYDKVEGVLKPINKRLATRAIREQEKDINTNDDLPKSGMISLQQAKQHGLIK